MNNDKSCCNKNKSCGTTSTSPQITTKISEHGTNAQINSVMESPNTASNLENTKNVSTERNYSNGNLTNSNSQEDYTLSYLESSNDPNMAERNGQCSCSATTYAPKDRTDYAPSNGQLTSVSESGGRTKATDPVEDPIAVNNIANAEFNNTEDIKTD